MRDVRRHAHLLVVHAILRFVLYAAVFKQRNYSGAEVSTLSSSHLSWKARCVTCFPLRIVCSAFTSVTSDPKEPTHLSCGSPAFAQNERVYRLQGQTYDVLVASML